MEYTGHNGYATQISVKSVRKDVALDLIYGASALMIAAGIYVYLQSKLGDSILAATKMNMFLLIAAFILIVLGLAFGVRAVTYSFIGVYADIRNINTLTPELAMIEHKGRIAQAVSQSGIVQTELIEKLIGDISIDISLGEMKPTKWIRIAGQSSVLHQPVSDWVRASMSPMKKRINEMVAVNQWSDSTGERDAIIVIRNELRERGILMKATGPNPERIMEGWSIYDIAIILDVSTEGV